MSYRIETGGVRPAQGRSPGGANRILLALFCLPGPTWPETLVVRLFGPALLESALRAQEVIRVPGGFAPSESLRREVESLLRWREGRQRLHHLLANRIRRSARSVSKQRQMALLVHHEAEAGEIETAVELGFLLARCEPITDPVSREALKGLLRKMEDPESQAKLLRAMQSAAEEAGEWKKALESARQITRLLPKSVDGWIQRARLSRSAGSLSESERSLSQAFRLPQTGRERILLLAHRAQVRVLRRNPDAAGEDVRALQALVSDRDSEKHFTLVRQVLGNYHYSRADYVAALRSYEECIRICRTNRETLRLIEVCQSAVAAAVHLRQFVVAERYWKEGFERIRGGADPQGLARFHLLRAQIELELGNADRAYASALEAVSLYEKLQIPGPQAEAMQHAGYLALENDDLAVAEKWSQRARMAAAPLSDLRVRARATSVLAQVQARRGRLQEAWDLLEQAEGEQAQLHCPKVLQFVLRGRIELAKQCGAWKRMLLLARQAERNAEKMRDFSRAVEFRMALSEAMLRLGRRFESGTLLTSVRELVESDFPSMASEAMVREWLGDPEQLRSIPGKVWGKVRRNLKTPRRKWLAALLRSRSLSSLEEAQEEADDSVRWAERCGAGIDLAETLEGAADLRRWRGEISAAQPLYRRAEELIQTLSSSLPPREEEGRRTLEEIGWRLRRKREFSAAPGQAIEVIAAADEMTRQNAPFGRILSILLRALGREMGGVRPRLLLTAHGQSRERGRSFPLVFHGEQMGSLTFDSGRCELSMLAEVLAHRVAETLFYRRKKEKKAQKGERPAFRSWTASPSNRTSSLDPFDAFRSYVGRSVLRERIVDECRRLAVTDVPVLLVGETGTGKEVLARSIHSASAWRKGPFVIVSCSSLSPGTFLSELFGHERGAFSGAERSREGLIRSAEGGTLFLDGVDELGPEIQSALLRSLESHAILPVGAQREIPVRFRLLSSSLRPLGGVDGETSIFRQDLRYRLEGAVVSLPPLRERREDLLGLLEHFHGGRITFTTDAMALLTGYSWPGNVRELRNLVERILTAGWNTVDRSSLDRLLAPPVSEVSPVPRSRYLHRSREERRVLQEAISSASTMKEVAERLGWARATLYRKLRKHGIPPLEGVGRVSS